MNEEWRAVTGFEGLYEVSNLGRVRSLDRTDRLGRRRPGRVLAGSDIGTGHRSHFLWDNGDYVTRTAHRMTCEAFHGPAPADKPWALHRDGDSTNNRADNLYWGTPSDNMQDTIRHGSYRNQNTNKSECKWGHAFDEANTGRTKSGKRYCKRCDQSRPPRRKSK